MIRTIAPNLPCRTQRPLPEDDVLLGGATMHAMIVSQLVVPVLLIGVSPDGGAAAPDFCARLAVNAGIDKPAAPDGRTEWTVNAMNFGQRFVFGGSAATGVGVRPIEPATVEDYRRLEKACEPAGKGAACHLVGPVNFKFIWKGQTIMTPMAAGERATILVQGTRTTCRTEPGA